MIMQYEVQRNGPYVRVLVPDCASNWPRLEREVDDALEEGVTIARIIAPRPIGTGELKRVVALNNRLTEIGVVTTIEWRQSPAPTGVSGG